MKSIGFIGLGTMGEPMAANLLQNGYTVTVFNRSQGKAERLVSLGADVAASPLEVATATDIVITIISNDQAIEDVYYGANGIIAGIKPSQTIIDSSTISPDLARRLAADIQARFADFLDAPVTGSKPAAEAGSLVFMVGGSRNVLAEVEPLLLSMGRKAIYMGENGNGSSAKLAHNTVVGINAVGLMEGMAMAASTGIDANAFLELIQSGGAASKQAELKGEKMIQHDFSNQFSLALMLKDLRLSSVLSDKQGVPTPMLEAAKSQFQTGYAMGYGDLDLSALIMQYERWVGSRLSEAGLASNATTANASTAEESAADAERRSSTRLPLNIPLMLSIYQWEQEGAFSGQSIQGSLIDLSHNGLQIATNVPLEKDMFIILHFQQDSGMPPMTARIIRIEPAGEAFNYGCMLTGLPPYQRIQLQEYIASRSGN